MMSLLQILGASMMCLILFPVAAFPQRVTAVPAGDKVVIDGVGTVRLLGVRTADAPAVRLGNRTTDQRSGTEPKPSTPMIGGAINLKRDRPSRTFLRQLVLGKAVRIEYDSLAAGKERAYLFLEDGTSVNAELLRTGHARVDLSRPFSREAEFKRLEDGARNAELGIWMQRPR
jgi:micrococcal nuclease